MSNECIFCRIIAGDLPHERFWEDDEHLAFLDITQATLGHTLVVPKTHTADIFSIDNERAARLMSAVHNVAALLETKLQTDGITLLQNNRAGGWQSVFHMHFHVVPRYHGDGLIEPWQYRVASPEERAAALQRLT